jgi:hypothetical protein
VLVKRTTGMGLGRNIKKKGAILFGLKEIA